MPAETPQGVPESIVFDSFEGYKNTVDRERLGARDLAVAINIDLDDVGQPHRRRGRTLVATGNFHSLFNADDGSVYGVKNGDLGVINDDYSFTILLTNVAGDYDAGEIELAYWQIGDTLYFTSPYGSGIISHTTGQVSSWGPAQNFFLSPVVNPSSTLPAIRVKLLGAPPLASYLGYYNGRFYLAAGRFLWATEFQLYNVVDKNRGYIQFENDITMVGVVTDGIYVGTTTGVFFLSGGSFETLKRQRVMDSPVIPGSQVYIPGELANPPQVGLQPVTPMQVSIAFMTTRGFCVGEDSGRCANLTEAKVFFPNATRATAFYRRQDGLNQYVTCLDSAGTPSNSARFGDFVDAQIIRGFNGVPALSMPTSDALAAALIRYGLVIYDAALTVTLAVQTPLQLNYNGAASVVTTNRLMGGFVGKVLWDGALLSAPSATTTYLLAVTLTILPIGPGGSLTVNVGSKSVSPFAHEATQTLDPTSMLAQKLTFQFPISASDTPGYIMVSSTVAAALSQTRVEIFPLSP